MLKNARLPGRQIGEGTEHNSGEIMKGCFGGRRLRRRHDGGAERKDQVIGKKKLKRREKFSSSALVITEQNLVLGQRDERAKDEGEKRKLRKGRQRHNPGVLMN